MSAIADLINKVLWQCTVYFQGLDLRAEAQGWDTVYPTYTHPGTLTQHAIEYVLHNDKAGYIILIVEKLHSLHIPVFGFHPKCYLFLLKILKTLKKK